MCVDIQDFWRTERRKAYRESMSERLALLRIWAEYRVPFVRRYAQMRADSRSLPRVARGTMCWCCHIERATQIHHIIQVQHGGNNKKQNRLPLCRSCHTLVHPWMTDTPRTRRKRQREASAPAPMSAPAQGRALVTAAQPRLVPRARPEP